MWSAASEYLLKFLQFLQSTTGSWGLAIIAMTIIIRILLHPLNAKQMKSMQQMQRIQPRLKVLQEKYGDDKEALSRETMALYKEYKVNPAAGCLPLLIQLPILILLFNVLRNAASTITEVFLGIPLGASLTSVLAGLGGVEFADPMAVGFGTAVKAVASNPAIMLHVGAYLPILLLIVAIIFMTWYQQKLTSSNNPQMAMMNIFMPLFMGWICLNMPGGLVLYWALSTLFGVLQQMYTVRSVAKEEKPALYQTKPTDKTPAEKAVFTPKPARETRPAPKKEYTDIPAAKTGAVYDNFDDFIPRKRK